MKDKKETDHDVLTMHSERRCFEGASGVQALEKFCREVGYHNGEFLGDHPLLNFLADNPGAIDAIRDWINENMSNDQLLMIGIKKCDECYEFFRLEEDSDEGDCPNCSEEEEEEEEED
jgi:hypothetical protein